MKSLIIKSTVPLGILFIAVMALTFVSVISFSKVTLADNGSATQSGRLITIHDRGVEKVILTQAKTIGDALTEAEISIDSNDTVEPAVSEELIASDYQVNIYRARPVTIVDGNVRKKIVTSYQTISQIAASAGIQLYDEDITVLGQSNDIIADGAGLQLTITRATPFDFTLYGKTYIARTQAKTVGEMLAEKGIKLAENDRVTPSINTKIANGLAVRVWREGKQTITVDESIDFETKTTEDANRDINYHVIDVAGEKGTRSVTYEVLIQDGVEVGRTEIASLVIKQPKTQAETIGVMILLSKGYSAERISIMTAAGISESDQGYAAFIVDHENGLWCPTRWQGQSGCPAVYQEKFAGAEESDQVGYGLCQSTPAIKMASIASDWRTNPVTQMKWCSNYATTRYGSWYAAYSVWTNHAIQKTGNPEKGGWW